MPKNKNALERWLIIDDLLHRFGGTRFYTQDELFTKLNDRLEERGLSPISMRTFQDDIQSMIDGDFQAPIKKGWLDRERTYMYEDPHFTISNKNINETEMRIIREALSTLSTFKGRPNFEWMEQIRPLLSDNVQLNHIKQVISYEENEDLTNSNLVGDLYTDITNLQPIEILYQKFGTKAERRLLSPYYLKQYNNRWFLIGQEEEYEGFSTFAVDRIQTIAPTVLIKYKETKVDFEDYFYDIVGVTRYANEPVQTIVLWVSAGRYPYIATKPLHPTQKLLKNEKLEIWSEATKNFSNGVLISIDVAINHELKNLLLSYGCDIIVLSPKKLKEEIFNNIEASYQKYIDLRK
jgi:predicted DNA-binding transcriptional regulator YafY